MINSAYQKYQHTQLQTASPTQLLLMLYDGAIRFIRVGISGIEEKDVQKTNTYLGKAQGVIHELIAALNYDYQISNILYSVYEYMIHQLIQANIYKEKEAANEVLNFLIDLREAWDMAGKSLNNSSIGLV
ncbi:flagellar export chaperone FliS [Paenibacillus graminis]|uniref:flagellar export chaperone FliS n=1 Tax=Paenibacillus graminis TaxID=189425 RepID=UPI002DB89E9E|nr:flagellar export chaperone FliS [Paenibacillus graminis]MEC0171898.1 flagellar export chaperone FliS [Paenibacillus graminis]